MTQSGQPGAHPPSSGAPAPPPGPPPAAPPPPDWQSPPQQPSSAPAAGSMPSWTGNITSTQPVAGPAGFYYADVPNRIIAFIIDYIIFLVVFFIVGVVTLSILGTNVGFGLQLQSTASVLVQNILANLLVGAYFIYTWVAMRGTAGMKVLGMQIGHQSDGRTLTYQQAALRFALIFGPGFIAGLLSAFVLALGLIASLVSLVWFIILLVTTAQSPTKQGLHDRYAETMVVKAARSVG